MDFRTLLFGIEWFHAFGHVSILFGVRLLPHKDMKLMRHYFLTEVISTCLLVPVIPYWLCGMAFVHILLHVFYWIFWHGDTARQIIFWSTLDYQQSDPGVKGDRASFLLTCYDVIVHLCAMYQLGRSLTVVQTIAAVVISQGVAMVIMYGPFYAWASPNRVPPWIQKRVQPKQIR